MKTNLIISQLKALLENSNNSLGNLANAASLLYFELGDINWAGFYFYDENCDTLKLGPFVGKIACMQIKNKSGVCGTAFASMQPQCVKNVHEFPGHIACDAATNSELVVPLTVNSQPIGVIDLDSTTRNRFGEAELALVEQFASVLANYLDANKILAAITH